MTTQLEGDRVPQYDVELRLAREEIERLRVKPIPLTSEELRRLINQHTFTSDASWDRFASMLNRRFGVEAGSAAEDNPHGKTLCEVFAQEAADHAKSKANQTELTEMAKLLWVIIHNQHNGKITINHIDLNTYPHNWELHRRTDIITGDHTITAYTADNTVNALP